MLAALVLSFSLLLWCQLMQESSIMHDDSVSPGEQRDRHIHSDASTVDLVPPLDDCSIYDTIMGREKQRKMAPHAGERVRHTISTSYIKYVIYMLRINDCCYAFKIIHLGLLFFTYDRWRIPISDLHAHSAPQIVQQRTTLEKEDKYVLAWLWLLLLNHMGSQR